MDETSTVVTRSDDGESVEALSWIGDDTKLREGVWHGSLKTGGIADDGMAQKQV